MDSRIYFHQYRRPRNNNPTYVSSNVNQSLTFFDNSRITFAIPKQTYKSNLNHYQPNYFNKPSQDISNLQKFQTISHSPKEVTPSSKQRGVSLSGRTSNLSNYGSTSLQLTQNDIFNKQNNRFNIITMQPKQYDISIRQNPKFSLENKDQLYYRRMKQESEKKKMYEEIYDRKSYGNGKSEGEIIAGKYTYDRDRNGSTPTVSVEPQVIYQNYNELPTTHKQRKQFTPKLLSQMDELISLS